jgi:SAM-dependent methyltransferase
MDPVALECFDAILKTNFDEVGYQFFSLRTNAARTELVVNHLLSHASATPGRLLNVGAGGFVFDFILGHARPWSIVSFDRELSYMPLYRALQQKGLLPRTSFMIADLRDCDFASGCFQFILAHDLLYEPSLELSWLLPKFARWLEPEGFLYFDVWDQRARGLWQLSSRYRQFHRYDLSQVRQLLKDHGFRIVSEAPYFGSRMILREVRKVLWAWCGLSNTRHFLVQRRA